MRLKEFQEQALQTFAGFLAELKRQQTETGKRIAALEKADVAIGADDRDYVAKTWAALGQCGLLPHIKNNDGSLSPPPYARRQDSRGQVIPHVCLKLPTGGGKTLLGAAAIERMRPTAGLVLWITPSRAIFRQTWRAFAHRLHPYRQYLERACGGRIKLLKKTDMFSLADVENYLCVMPLMLQAADREDRSFLKIFGDTGHYPSFFPEPDDQPANNRLLDTHPDLDTADLAEDSPGSVRHSLFNVFKLLRPIIVLDEAHNAYTAKRRRRLNEFNPRFVLELSATPEASVSNILVDTPGSALKREQMIKLPLNLHNFENTDWKYTLSRAKERLDKLKQETRQLQGESGRYIRPMMIIRVERVGREQRDGEHIHAEDVRDYLMTQLNVPETHIRRKTAERDEIADEDLLSPYSAVRYILTKDALREGWDCPFAYVLTLLDSTRTARALTQMTGRILRQPDTELTGRAALDESYIYCLDRDVGEAIQAVKRGLEQEGMGDLSGLVHSGQGNGGPENNAQLRRIPRRKAFRDMRIFLPQVLHRAGRRYRPLDYEGDVLSGVDWQKITAAPLGLDYAGVDKIREITALVDLPGFDYDTDAAAMAVDRNLSVEFFSRRLYETLPNPFLAGKAVEAMLQDQRGQGRTNDDIFDRRYHLSEMLKRRLTELVEHEAKDVFRRKLQAGDIRFELIAGEDGFELEQVLKHLVGSGQMPLLDQQGDSLKKSLYEKLYAAEFNGLEKDFALYLDGHSAVTWWHRFAARPDYALQGWKPNRVYPDFVVCVGQNHGNGAGRRVLALETKGLQLAGNMDTQYKNNLFEALSKTEPKAVECGTLRLPGSKRNQRRMGLHILFQDGYQQAFEELVRA